jgi:hypothetical protein
VTTPISDLQTKIDALKNAKLPTDNEEAELAELMAGEPMAAPTVAVAVGAESVLFTVEVDRESFDRGGVGFTSPSDAGIYKGVFKSVQQSNQDKNRYMFVFETTDTNLAMQHRSAINCSLVDRRGDFVLKNVLENMGWQYKAEGNQVSFSVVPDQECWLDYQGVTLDGREQVRLQQAYQLDKIQPAI